MCNHLKKRAIKFFRYWRTIWKTKLPTEMQKQVWKEFDNVLNYRANLVQALIVVQNFVWYFFDRQRYMESEEYLADPENPCDRELVLAIFPYVKWTLNVINILRIVLMVVSFWKPGICKSYLYLQLLFWGGKHLLPIDTGILHGRFFIS